MENQIKEELSEDNQIITEEDEDDYNINGTGNDSYAVANRRRKLKKTGHAELQGQLQ